MDTEKDVVQSLLSTKSFVLVWYSLSELEDSWWNEIRETTELPGKREKSGLYLSQIHYAAVEIRIRNLTQML